MMWPFSISGRLDQSSRVIQTDAPIDRDNVRRLKSSIFHGSMQKIFSTQHILTSHSGQLG